MVTGIDSFFRPSCPSEFNEITMFTFLIKHNLIQRSPLPQGVDLYWIENTNKRRSIGFLVCIDLKFKNWFT
jgi:hypothetical protein